MVDNIDATPPVFASIVVTSNNTKNPNFAKAGDEIKFTLNIAPEDTWAKERDFPNFTGNKVDFSIGGGATKNSRAFSHSDTPRADRNLTYDVVQNESDIGNSSRKLVGNGSFTFSNLVFKDKAGNDITHFTAPYTPTNNVTLDTIFPEIIVEKDIPANTERSHTIAFRVNDTHPDTASYKYAFIADKNLCNANNTSATFDNTFTSGGDITISDRTHQGKYVCIKAEDMAGNTSFKALDNPVNIVDNPPVLRLIGSPTVTVEL